MNISRRSSTQRITNLIAAGAGILLLPALHVISAEFASLGVRSTLPPELVLDAKSPSAIVGSALSQELHLFEEALRRLQGCRVTCMEAQGTVSGNEANFLIGSASSAGWIAKEAFSRSMIIRLTGWSPSLQIDRWIPFSSGLSAVYEASSAAEHETAQMNYRSRGFKYFCARYLDSTDNRDGSDEGVDSLRKSEQENQAWIDEQVPKLKELHQNLLEAQKVFDRDSPRLTALAWSLGIFEVIGLSLLFFVVLPYPFGGSRG